MNLVDIPIVSAVESALEQTSDIRTPSDGISIGALIHALHARGYFEESEEVLGEAIELVPPTDRIQVYKYLQAHYPDGADMWRNMAKDPGFPEIDQEGKVEVPLEHVEVTDGVPPNEGSGMTVCGAVVGKYCSTRS